MFKENTVFILLANWFLPVATYNGTFLKKYQLLALFGDLEVKLQFLAVLRHLEGFLEKSEESRKLKNNGGLLSAIFL